MPTRHGERGTAVKIFTDDEVNTGYVSADYTLIYSPSNTHTAVLIFHTQSREQRGYFVKGCGHVVRLLCI
jgi:hypothetical protein